MLVRIKELEMSTICIDNLRVSWNFRHDSEHTNRSSVAGCPFQSSLLLGSPFNNMGDSFERYVSIFLAEKVVELLMAKHPAASKLATGMRSDVQRRLIGKLEVHCSENTSQSSMYCLSLIRQEVSRLEKILGCGSTESSELPDILSIEPDASSGWVAPHLLYSNNTITTLPPVDRVYLYILTFLCAPLTCSKLSRSMAITELFDGNSDWKAVFAVCNLGETLGSQYLESAVSVLHFSDNPIPILSMLITERFSTILLTIPEIKTHLEDIPRISGVSWKSAVEAVHSMIFRQVNNFLPAENGVMRLSVHLVSVLCRYLIACKIWLKIPLDKELLRMTFKLGLLDHILSQHACAIPSPITLNEILSKFGSIFFDPTKYSPEVSFLASLADYPASFTPSEFHMARMFAQSSKEEDRDRALALFEICEMEISSLFSNQLRVGLRGSCEGAGISRKEIYHLFLAQIFAPDYKREIACLAQIGGDQVSSPYFPSMVEKAIAYGDWERARNMMFKVSSEHSLGLKGGRLGGRLVNLMCTEARIRGELPKVFDLVKSRPELVRLILIYLEDEVKLEFAATGDGSIRSTEQLLSVVDISTTLFNLNVCVGNFDAAFQALLVLHEMLLCEYSQVGDMHQIVASSDPDRHAISFDILAFNQRLNWQLRALLLARSNVSRTTNFGGQKHLSYLQRKFLFLKGVIAIYSFTTEWMPDLHEDGVFGVSPARLCANLSARGLVVLSADIARVFQLDLVRVALVPFCVLLLRDEMPPCRLDGQHVLAPSVSPSMAFARSDKSGPIGTCGNQILAMYAALEYVLRNAVPSATRNGIVDLIPFFASLTGTIPAFLVSLAEERGLWLELLKAHMRIGNYQEAVRLVEVHVKFWRPSVTRNPLCQNVIINVPLLVQLQQALAAVDDEGSLRVKLNDTLDVLKDTLRLAWQRAVM